MKRILFLTLAVVMAVAGCNKNEGPAAEINIDGSSNVTVPEGTASVSVTFTTNYEWTAGTGVSWAKISPAAGKASQTPVSITITLEPNTGSEPRVAVVKITAGGVSKDITLTQPAYVDPAAPKAVDLGLSVLWADRNIGAEKPEDCGNYYAWSETNTKDSYNFPNCKWFNGGFKANCPL